MIKKLQIISCICYCLLTVSCHDSDKVEPAHTRTVLVYMAADNSLSRYGDENISLMMEGMKDFNGNLILYFDSYNKVPSLLQITYEKGEAVKKVIRTYPEENSASPEVLSRVIIETRELFPADSYGLILWSHGLGWLPVNYNFPGAYRLMNKKNVPPTKFFALDDHPGDTEGKGIQIEELARVLPRDFSFILFDACFMGAVETVYELRNNAEYIIASPAEIIANGFPYNKILPYLWGGEEDYKQICREFYDFYDTHPNGSAWQSATIALVKTSGLKRLAENVQDILHDRSQEVAGIDIQNIRRYTLIGAVPDVFFDFGEFVREVATEKQYETFKAQLNEAVVYKLATKNFNDKVLPTDKYSGLSTYIPLQCWSGMDNYYFDLDWVSEVY